jgi:hypothetical protein
VRGAISNGRPYRDSNTAYFLESWVCGKFERFGSLSEISVYIPFTEDVVADRTTAGQECAESMP